MANHLGRTSVLIWKGEHNTDNSPAHHPFCLALTLSQFPRVDIFGMFDSFWVAFWKYLKETAHNVSYRAVDSTLDRRKPCRRHYTLIALVYGIFSTYLVSSVLWSPLVCSSSRKWPHRSDIWSPFLSDIAPWQSLQISQHWQPQARVLLQYWYESTRYRIVYTIPWYIHDDTSFGQIQRHLPFLAWHPILHSPFWRSCVYLAKITDLSANRRPE